MQPSQTAVGKTTFSLTERERRLIVGTCFGDGGIGYATRHNTVRRALSVSCLCSLPGINYDVLITTPRINCFLFHFSLLNSLLHNRREQSTGLQWLECPWLAGLSLAANSSRLVLIQDSWLCNTQCVSECIHGVHFKSTYPLDSFPPFLRRLQEAPNKASSQFRSSIRILFQVVLFCQNIQNTPPECFFIGRLSFTEIFCSLTASQSKILLDSRILSLFH